MTTAIETAPHYLERFAEFENGAAGRELAWLRESRRAAFARFCAAGFPTAHDEDWRFTDVSAIRKTNFRLAERGSVSREQIRPWLMQDVGCTLVFLNGRFARDLSVIGEMQAGATAGGLAEALENDAGFVEQHMGHYADPSHDSFCALNTAFAEDGALVHISRGTIMEETIHLLFVSTAETPVMNHPRNLIVVEAESECTVVEEYVSLGGGSIFCNAVTELVAGENSAVSHYRIEREQARTYNISTLRIQQERSSNVASHSLLMGGALVRNNVHPVLAGEGGECLINGLFVGSEDQHLDNYMVVEHASPHCGSRQFYNGILDGHARGVFHGRIIVHKAAQKTDAKQTNRNLLLSDDARIDTKPQLEIHADDVKCTHGATIGQMDEEALFYLRSRGIDEVSARGLLLRAFAGECTARMKEGTVRARMEELVRRYVKQFAGTGLPRETSHE